MIVTKANYEGVDFKDLAKPVFEPAQQNGVNQFIVEPTSGFTLEKKESMLISTVLPIKDTLSFPDLKVKGFYPIMRVDTALQLPSKNFLT